MAPLNVLNDENPRQIAARVLGQRRANGLFVEDLFENAVAHTRLSPADRGLCQEIIYGVVRWQATLDWLIARKTGGREQKPALQNFLRLGLYQIFWLDRIPDHAAVHQTVELAKQNGFGPQAGFVNAVLRGFLREADETKKLLADLKISHPALGWSHPEWLVTRWHKRWGPEKTAQLLKWNNSPPKTYARVNTLKFRSSRGNEAQTLKSATGNRQSAIEQSLLTSAATRELKDVGDLLTRWREENLEYDFVRRDWLEENLAFELKSHPPLVSLGSFRDGGFYVQDPGTLLAVQVLDPQPGENVLDLCAAPGGKTTFIAQRMNNQGRIVARDITEDRLKLIHENCARLGVTCVKTQVDDLFRPHPDPLPQEREQQSTASVSSCGIVPPPAHEFAETQQQLPPLPGGEGGQKNISSTVLFDRVLVDAPCSNTGVMRRRVDLRWRISPEEISRLQQTQLELLATAATKSKPGGTLVYSTCSLEPEENSEVVKQFLATHAGFKLEIERQLLPFDDGVDGAYVARLKN